MMERSGYCIIARISVCYTIVKIRDGGRVSLVKLTKKIQQS